MKKILFYILIVIIFFSFLPFGQTKKTIAETCSVKSAVWSPSGEQKDTWFKEETTEVKINVKTLNCINKGIFLTLLEEDSYVGGLTDDTLSDSRLLNRKITVPSDNFDIILKVGEEECASSTRFDCDMYFTISDGTTTYSSAKNTGGFLYYDCDGVCDKNWKLISPLDGVNVDAQKVEKEFSGDYNLLAPIGNLNSVNNKDTNFGDYLNTILLIAIGLCGALAVIMIVIYGVQYMGDESVFGKTEAKSNIKHAIMGVILALGAYLILNAINPKLTGGTVSANKVTIELEGDVNAPVSVNKKNVSSVGFTCNGGGKPQIPTIAKSFKGKMTYSQEIPKGQLGPKNTIKLDCSGFVNYVLSCAGVDNSKINSGTSVIFSSAEKVTSITNTQVNGKDLQLGDLVGWRPQDSKNGNGHVLIYIGGGQVADSHGGSGRNPGNALGIYPTTHYKDKIKFVKRI